MSGSKNWSIYMMEYYAAERKKELLPFVTAWVELEIMELENSTSEALQDCEFGERDFINNYKLNFFG